MATKTQSNVIENEQADDNENTGEQAEKAPVPGAAEMEEALIPFSEGLYQVHLVELYLESYIAQPYWPEMNQVIDIQKKSGMNYAKSDEKRAATIAAYLQKIEMPQSAYDTLVAKARRPWYRVNPDDPSTEIVIPRHQFAGCMVETCLRSPSSVIKTGLADNLRTLVRVSDFGTGKQTHDTTWARYIKHESTNQRRYQEDVVLQDFKARGYLTFDPKVITTKTVEMTLKYAMANIGVGGSRKMGYGRGKVMSIRSLRDVESPLDAPKEVPPE